MKVKGWCLLVRSNFANAQHQQARGIKLTMATIPFLPIAGYAADSLLVSLYFSL